MAAIFAIFNVNNASRRGTTNRRLKYSGKTREGARNHSLMKERVEQVQISAHTSVIHATIIVLISKRASNNALPRIDLIAQEKEIYTEEIYTAEYEAEVQSRPQSFN